MSNFSDDGLAARLLDAIAQECRVLSQEIALLGGRVSGGTADIAALQSFDFLAQHAEAQAMLAAYMARLDDSSRLARDMPRLLDAIPLPYVRARLRRALGCGAEEPVHDDETLLWVEE